MGGSNELAEPQSRGRLSRAWQRVPSRSAFTAATKSGAQYAWAQTPSRETVWSGACKTANGAKAIASAVKTGVQRTHQLAQDHPKTAILLGVPAGIIATPYVLSMAGFGSGGIVAGSIAAKVQSVVYAGYTTGVFSAATSAGAAGIGTTGAVVAGGSGAAVAAAVVLPGKKSDKKETAAAPPADKE